MSADSNQQHDSTSGKADVPMNHRLASTYARLLSEVQVCFLNQSQGGMYIEVAMMISWVALVNRSHPYLENDPAP